MGKITIQSALGQFTQLVIKAINERKKPTAAFGTFFTDVVSGSKEVSWEIKRRGRPVAVDIAHHEHGTVTKSAKSTQKIYIPPYYDLATNVDALDSFERVFGGMSHVDIPQYDKLIQETAEDARDNLDRIERAEELQRSQAFLTGIIQLHNGDNIDFKRKAASLLAFDSANDWLVDTVHPGAIMAQGCAFMVTEGDADSSGIFNIFMGDLAYNAFRANPLVQKESDIKNFHFADLSTNAVVSRTGAVPQGSYSYGNYRFNIWGYEGYYDVEGGSSNLKYMDSKSIVILPQNIDFKMFYGGTKAWRGTGINRFPTVIKGKRNFYTVDDEINVSKLFGVRTSPVVLLRSIDNIFTAVVVGDGEQG